MRSVERRRRSPTLVHRLLLVAAVMLAVTGVGQLALIGLGWLPGAPPGVEPVPQTWVASADGMVAAVREAHWVEHDMSEDTAGYQMPLSMMPGMPADGTARLSVALTLTNTAAVGRGVLPADEFELGRTGADDRWPVAADTFGGLSRLADTSAVSGVLFFDLPEQSTGRAEYFVAWGRSGEDGRLAVPLDGAYLGHEH